MGVSDGPEAGEAPDSNKPEHVPSTWPGFRLPHVWLEDGSAIHDHPGRGLTLLRFDNDHVVMSDLIFRFAGAGVAFDVTSFDDPHAVDVYEGYALFFA